MRSTNKSGDSGLGNPITGTAGCARTTSGQSDAEPTRPLMKSRLRTQSPTNDRLSFYKSYQMSVWPKEERCPLWVKSGHVRCTGLCPLYPEGRHVRCNQGCPLWADSGHPAAYSMISPARASSECGTVRLSGLAVLRLIANSYLVAA